MFIIIFYENEEKCILKNHFYFLNSFFNILPVALMGSADIDWMWRGYL